MQELRAKILLRIRILLESLFLWTGGITLYFVLIGAFMDQIMHTRNKAGIYTLLVILFAAVIIWILVGRRKDLDERIKTYAYVIWSLLPGVIVGGVLLVSFLQGATT